MGSVAIIDATLREGRQAPEVTLDAAASLEVARGLAASGVDMIEVGHPSASPAERERVRAVVDAGLGPPVLAHARATARDVEAVADAGADWVGVFLGVNETTRRARVPAAAIEELLARIDAAVRRAKELGLGVRYTVEDASRTTDAELVAAYRRAVDAGADRLCFADSVGALEPSVVASRVAAVRAAFPALPLEVHLHNDRGLALANALAAVDAGASWVSASVLGLGERCGITDTCALMANLAHRGQRVLPPPGTLPALAATVARLAGIPHPRRAPVIGLHAFTHTARLHVLAVARDPNAYAWMPPEALGRVHATAPIREDSAEHDAPPPLAPPAPRG
ncbi:MAG: homocitrate synthase [Deltaproteobacteria bacterium HGW-Deltaproteobacteria-14]|jgi:2-isopropylmalate synthase|nr:MAG: homocitrate synthase [Deltaproteobacteria bacterium HGW-Deltaproteobacteria-14]